MVWATGQYRVNITKNVPGHGTFTIR